MLISDHHEKTSPTKHNIITGMFHFHASCWVTVEEIKRRNYMKTTSLDHLRLPEIIKFSELPRGCLPILSVGAMTGACVRVCSNWALHGAELLDTTANWSSRTDTRTLAGGAVLQTEGARWATGNQRTRTCPEKRCWCCFLQTTRGGTRAFLPWHNIPWTWKLLNLL